MKTISAKDVSVIERSSAQSPTVSSVTLHTSKVGAEHQVVSHDKTRPTADSERASQGTHPEMSLVCAVQNVLAISGRSLPLGDVRNLMGSFNGTFNPETAVSTFNYFGLQASYYEMPVQALSVDYCPAVGFLMNGEAIVICALDNPGHLLLRRFGKEPGAFREMSASKKALTQYLMPYFILASATLTPSKAKAKPKRKGFWTSVLQPKQLFRSKGEAVPFTKFVEQLRGLGSYSKPSSASVSKTQGAAKPKAQSESFAASLDSETALILAVRHILSVSGLSFSASAVRDLPELTKVFEPKSAVSVFRNLGFEASYGGLPPKDLRPGHCPAIGFLKNGEAVVIYAINEAGNVHLRRLTNEADFIEKIVPLDHLDNILESYVILARKIHSATNLKDKNDWFWGALRQSKWLYFQVIVAAALTNFLGLSTSLFVMVVYDRVVPNQAIESLIALTVGVLIALSFDFIVKTLRAQFVDTAGQRADARMSRLIFDKILAMKIDGQRQKSGALASIVREFETLKEFFTSATLIAIVDLPFIFFFIWVISLISGPLALVPLIAVPVVLAAGIGIQPFLARITQGSMQSNMSKQSVLVETLNGLETVQATGSGRLMRRRFEEAAVAQSDMGLKSRMLSNFAINSAASVQQLAQIATIFYGVFLIQDGTITMGAMIAAMILGGRALAPLSQLASAMARANGAREAYRSLSAIMSPAGEEAQQVHSRLSRPHLSGDVEFKGVSYTFPGANSPIIKDLTLKIPGGQKVAIMGRMGSGKSTMLRLMSGLVEPTAGAVLIDGVDLRQIDKSDIRRNIGVMLQETWMFSGTVKENLQMGFYEYDDAHILNIAKISGVDDFMASHPQGYDLELKERGEGLSGGQRQSINLARAMLHHPSLLVLDEPTSSMDTATEKAVIGRLKAWLADRTVVMVTHRNTLLELADRVLVMDQGVVVADTTPDRLRAQVR